MSKLCIMAAKKCWVLHVDALIVGADGSLADAASLAVKVVVLIPPMYHFTCLAPALPSRFHIELPSRFYHRCCGETLPSATAHLVLRSQA